MTFDLHPNLKSKVYVADLSLCVVLLEDNSHYPWLFLVPKRPEVSKIMDLAPEDQVQLMVELDLAQKVLWKLFDPTQVNVAALGNKTPQLHVHVIARYASDPAWPGAVWGHPACKPYSKEEKADLLRRLKEAF